MADASLTRFLGPTARRYKVIAYDSCQSCGGLGHIDFVPARDLRSYKKLAQDYGRYEQAGRELRHLRSTPSSSMLSKMITSKRIHVDLGSSFSNGKIESFNPDSEYFKALHPMIQKEITKIIKKAHNLASTQIKTVSDAKVIQGLEEIFADENVVNISYFSSGTGEDSSQRTLFSSDADKQLHKVNDLYPFIVIELANHIIKKHKIGAELPLGTGGSAAFLPRQTEKESSDAYNRRLFQIVFEAIDNVLKQIASAKSDMGSGIRQAIPDPKKAEQRECDRCQGSGIGSQIRALPPMSPSIAKGTAKSTDTPKFNLDEWQTSADAVALANHIITNLAQNVLTRPRTTTSAPEEFLPGLSHLHPEAGQALASTRRPKGDPDFTRVTIVRAPDTALERATIVFDWVKGQQVFPKTSVAESISYAKFVNEMAVATGAIAAPPGGYKTSETRRKNGLPRKHKGAVILGGLRDDYNWHPSPGKMLIADVKKGDLVTYEADKEIRQGVASQLGKDHLIVRSEGMNHTVTHDLIISYRRHAIQDTPSLMSRIENMFEELSTPVEVNVERPVAWRPGMDFVGYLAEADSTATDDAVVAAGKAAAQVAANVKDTKATGPTATAGKNARQATLAAKAAAAKGEAKRKEEAKKTAEQIGQAIADNTTTGA